ncbi:hypothetical protein [Amycolatopsis anabasis]|uniref:hypothetical protein n=1 Tax=Amycolatopsis anabasis TaxID=1840409 RepID=UPI00131D6568|nr:hypothetical protein [Amycolatopsis anabasis]
MTGLIPYPVERALEDAAYAQGIAPTRIFALLLPVWRIEFRATITEAAPYALVDRYLERGIAEAGLNTTAELAGFFALDEPLVDRALRALVAAGHVTESSGRFALTALGERSLRDQVRYVVTPGARRELYFDGFGSRPLPRAYYDRKAVTLLDQDGLAAALARRDGPRFQPLPVLRSFRPEVLTELNAHPERERYHLPARIDQPEGLGQAIAHLPLYVVRGTGADGRARHLAYSQLGPRADADLTALCEQTPEIVAACENEERDALRDADQRWIHDWLSRHDLERHRPVALPGGAWRVTLPGASFGGAVPIGKLGSFVVRGSNVCHVWCTDEQVRRRALLQRIDHYLGTRSRVEPADVLDHIARVARQLELGAMNIATLHQIAMKNGKPELAAALTRLDT